MYAKRVGWELASYRDNAKPGPTTRAYTRNPRPKGCSLSTFSLKPRCYCIALVLDAPAKHSRFDLW